MLLATQTRFCLRFFDRSAQRLRYPFNTQAPTLAEGQLHGGGQVQVPAGLYTTADSAQEKNQTSHAARGKEVT
jgi:hypothetical protein